MQKNKLRQLLRAGKPTLGTHIHSRWPAVVEFAGQSGMFDYVEFVAEDVAFDLTALENFCRAAELHDLSSMIKVDQEPRTFLAQRGIGAEAERIEEVIRFAVSEDHFVLRRALGVAVEGTGA